jgi:hypothetical protein
MYFERGFTAAGGLMSYGIDYDNIFRQADIDRVLNGVKPASLPIQGPTKFTLVINVAAAKAIGIEAPTSPLTSSSVALTAPERLPLFFLASSTAGDGLRHLISRFPPRQPRRGGAACSATTFNRRSVQSALQELMAREPALR